MDITIRKINKEDHYNIECMTKKAFWNLCMPDGSNFDAFMGYELQENALSENKGNFSNQKAWTAIFMMRNGIGCFLQAGYGCQIHILRI